MDSRPTSDRPTHLFLPTLEKWDSCLIESSSDNRSLHSTMNCTKSSVHHPHQGGASQIYGELSVSEFRLRFTQMGDGSSPLLYRSDYLISNDIPISSIHRVNFVQGKKKSKITATSEPLKNAEDIESCQLEVLSADFNILKFETLGSQPFSKRFLEKLLAFGSRREASRLFGVLVGEHEFKGLKTCNPDRDISVDRAWLDVGLSEPPLNLRVFPVGERRLQNVEPSMGWTTENISDKELIALASFVEDRRVPVATCCVENRGVLFRCGKVAKMKKSEFLQRMSQFQQDLFPDAGVPAHTQVELIKLKARMPRLEDIAHSRKRLRDLCQCYNPESVGTNWLEALDATQWLSHVSRALSLASEVAHKLRVEGKWVLLSEPRASDWSCLISSLVQLLLFPESRRWASLERLVVREWTLAGHPFSSRLELATWSDDERTGPLFPLFLDCVHQLCVQFPAAFDFTADLLAVIHDLSHAGLFREFLAHLGSHQTLLAPSAFAWDLLLSPDGLALLQNPLHGLARLMGEEEEKVLGVDAAVRHMVLWREHYMRALTFMDVAQGGRAAMLWRYRDLLAELQPAQDVNGDATDVCLRPKNDGKAFRLPSGRQFADISAFFPLSNEEAVVDSSRVSCMPARPHSYAGLADE